MRRFAKVHVLFLNTARAISKSTRIITLSTAMVHPARAIGKVYVHKWQKCTCDLFDYSDNARAPFLSTKRNKK